MNTCSVCNEPMYADEEWRLRPGLSLDEPAESGDYVHDRCWSEARLVIEGGGDR